MTGIVCAYIGVHQIFQLALAAEEMNALDHLYCSLVDLPGKWGRLVSRIKPASATRPLGSGSLPPKKITEFPLPLLSRQLDWLRRRQDPTDYYESNDWFDKKVARKLAAHEGTVFLGVETCAMHSLEEAGRCGMKRLLDCPGIPAELLAREVERAADDIKMKVPTSLSSPRMLARKAVEFRETDAILLCSELQKEYYLGKGFDSSKIHVNPLWVDPAFTAQATEVKRKPRGSGPLRALFVGAATVAKGAPYAILAAELAGEQVSLTFCGGVDSIVRQWAGERLQRHRIIEWLPRAELAEIYFDHDVLLFPTLGDSFGFVALEAMTCGLPVIASAQAGAPLPDPSWRVPSRDAEAMAARLLAYARDDDKLRVDSECARAFVKDFTPGQFRHRAQGIFRDILK